MPTSRTMRAALLAAILFTWRKGIATPPQNVPDLVNDVRPQLIELGVR